MLESLKRIAAAKESNDVAALNDALADFARRAKELFLASVQRRLADFGDAYLRSIDDADDALNEILWRVYRNAGSFRGATDAEARRWVQRTIDNLLIDRFKKCARRAKIWREILTLVPKNMRKYLETTSDDK